jgi:hypothetical protein
MKKPVFVISFFLLALLAQLSVGQGCSDAGFCTINTLKPLVPDTSKLAENQVKVGAFYGTADNSIRVYGSYLEYNRRLTENFGLDVKLTSLAQNGNEIPVFGLSDIFINANYKVRARLNLTLGAKIPLNNADRTRDNLPLPMDYQSSLGTFDLVLGVGYEIKKLSLVAAIQQPLTQNNNQFFASQYPENSKLRNFQSTNQFVRSSDVLLRISYPLSITKKLTLTPSLLPIYHLANDKYTDENGREKEIDGSQGLSLNGNLYLDYSIDDKNSLQLNLARPFVVRDARPDGLTRSFIANLEYSMRL